MACGGKITKGGGMVVAIPFDATDVENLVVSVYTNGDEKIEKSGDDIRIGEGIIYVDMSKTDVDLLADGVVNYTMDYEIDGVQYSENGGTTNYIKTPKDYSATSITEVVQSAYTEGHEVGYQEGYEAGQQDCPECSGGTSCDLTETWIDLMEGDDLEGQGVDYYASAITPNYDGWYKVHIQDKDYGYSKYQEGYAAGQADCPECSGGSGCNLQVGGYFAPLWPETPTGIVTVYPEAGYDGFSRFEVNDGAALWSFNAAGVEAGKEAGYEEFQRGLTSFSFGPEQVAASGNGSFTYTNASGWSSVTIGMPLVYSCMIGFANIRGLLNILDASDVTDILFGYETLTQSEVIVGDSNITIYGTPTYGTGRFEGIRFAVPTSIFNQMSSWDASALSLNGFKSNLNAYIGGIALTPYRTYTWQSGDKTFISVSTFNFDN